MQPPGPADRDADGRVRTSNSRALLKDEGRFLVSFSSCGAGGGFSLARVRPVSPMTD